MCFLGHGRNLSVSQGNYAIIHRLNNYRISGFGLPGLGKIQAG